MFLKKILSFICRKGLRAFLQKLAQELHYQIHQKIHFPSQKTLEKQKNTVFAYQPLISILVPTYNTPLVFLQEMIDSVLAQTYPHWELCIADGNSQNPAVLEALKKYAAQDPRIKVVFLEENLHISENTNQAAKMAQGEWLALLDHDDILRSDALFENVALMNQKELDFIYSDEDKINVWGNFHFSPHFKADFSFQKLYQNNYICHFAVFRKTLFDQVGGFRSICNGAQDYDLFLRMAEKTNKIGYISKILYHWRTHLGSTAMNASAKDYTQQAGLLALNEHFQRMNLPCKAILTETPNCYKIVEEK